MCNPAAMAAGVRVGQQRATAQALVAGLQVLRRDPSREATFLHDLAVWCLQFSPAVCLTPPNCILIEIGGCLRYFGGFDKLLGQIQSGLAELQQHARIGVAPTPLAAEWLAHQEHALPLLDLPSLMPTLAQLPVSQLPWPRTTLEKLNALGIRRLGGLSRLPRAGLSRRFGPDLILQLDRAHGHLPDPRQAIQPPDQFMQTVGLNWATDSVEALLFVVKRLLTSLAGYLLARGHGTQQVRLQLHHANRQVSEHLIGFGQPTRARDGMLSIARERLQQLALAAPVEEITLHATELHRLDGETPGLFGEQVRQADFQLLRARLAARLGDEAIKQLNCTSDHRPEHAWHVAPPGEKPIQLDVGERPGWLLRQPQALETRQERPWYGEPLRLLGRAERIESGWWDGDAIARDYYRAEGPSGRRYWIYQQRSDGHWFLHGLFA